MLLASHAALVTHCRRKVLTSHAALVTHCLGRLLTSHAALVTHCLGRLLTSHVTLVSHCLRRLLTHHVTLVTHCLRRLLTHHVALRSCGCHGWGRITCERSSREVLGRRGLCMKGCCCSSSGVGVRTSRTIGVMASCAVGDSSSSGSGTSTSRCASSYSSTSVGFTAFSAGLAIGSCSGARGARGARRTVGGIAISIAQHPISSRGHTDGSVKLIESSSPFCVGYVLLSSELAFDTDPTPNWLSPECDDGMDVKREQ